MNTSNVEARARDTRRQVRCRRCLSRVVEPEILVKHRGRQARTRKFLGFLQLQLGWVFRIHDQGPGRASNNGE